MNMIKATVKPSAPLNKAKAKTGSPQPTGRSAILGEIILLRSGVQDRTADVYKLAGQLESLSCKLENIVNRIASD